MNTLTKQSKSLETGVFTFRPSINKDGEIDFFEGMLMNPEGGESTEPVVVSNIDESGEIFWRFRSVMDSGEKDIFNIEQESVWFQIIVVKYNSELIVCCNNITQQKTAEAELKKREKTFRLIAENSTDMICRLDLSARFLFVSPSSEKVVGYKPEELLGNSFYHYVHPDDYYRVKGMNLKFVKEPDLITISFRFRCKNNSYKWIESISKPIRNRMWEFIEIQSSVRDITERKDFEEQLKSLNAELERRVESRTMHLSAVLQNAPVILWSVNKDRRITFLDGKGLEVLEISPADGIGKKMEEFFKDDTEIIKNVEEAFKGKTLEKTLRYKNRSYREYYFPYKDSSGTIIGMTAIATDITDQVKIQEDLLASETKYKSMVEGIPQLVWTALPDGKVDFFNKKWYSYTGLSEDASLNSKWTSAVHPDDLPQIFEKVQAAKEQKFAITYEARFKNASDNQYRWHLVRVWPAKNPYGEVIRWIGTAADIHFQKEQNEELIQKNKELIRINNDLDNFIYTASHDLRAPISNMDGLLQAIEGNLNKECEAEIGLMVNMAEESVQRLRNTITELTEISRVQKNVDADTELIKIPEVIDDFVIEHRDEIAKSNAHILTEFEKEEVKFSRRNFRTIIYNLLSNAIKYKHPERDPKVFIKTEVVLSEYLLLKVQDNGLGFNKSDSDKIFGMFKRLHSHVEGSGVGLYIVKRVMENSGGKIEVKSTPGEGTVFLLYFKLNKA